ncbi:glycosyltransferase family 1 protein [Flavobacterium sp. MMLR14_040]|uniref:glycosyltransferase family 4 protein n=1 Tax=Flavobacterium sp. MMLR14_040 TaxID=3093843 RepID=UPI00299074A5|nr:glycosyltransferase family 1 protein [Flavobacterium sp. MMLR14_040]MDW8849261.1 glycosyltransferase family 1 protein [Flavobacterium sp. MMLR14_040]
MKILIDFTQIPLKKVGVGVYAMSLLKEINKIKKSEEYFVAVLNDDYEVIELLKESNVFKIIYLKKIFRRLVFRFLFEQFYLPILILKNKIDVVHSLHYSFPILPMKVKKVVTLHDMTFFLYPNFHKKINVFFFTNMIKFSVKCCDEIICVSEATKRDVFNILNVKKDLREKFVVVPLGVDDRKEIVLNGKDSNILLKHSLEPKKYLLFIGTIEPRKNIKSILEAYSMIHEKYLDYKLVIVGRKGWHYDNVYQTVEELKLGDRIVFTDFVTENEKNNLLANCYLFLYPSFYEGFGIPVLEAMSFGIPTITSKISSMPEVSGDAAILIDPYNVKEIADGITLLIDDKFLYQDLVAKSLKQVKKFTWNQMATSTMKAYLE